MRGYLSFVLVLASALVILNLVILHWQPQSISLANAIAVERVYQTQMNAKEVVLESIRAGGMEAFELYNKTHNVTVCQTQGPDHPLCFRIEEAREWARAGSFFRLATIDTQAFDEDMEVSIWCMSGITEETARLIANTDNCPICSSYKTSSSNLTQEIASGIARGGCAAYIYPEIVSYNPVENPELANFTITGGPTGSIGGSIGISVRYHKFNISSVSYIPAGYVVEP